MSSVSMSPELSKAYRQFSRRRYSELMAGSRAMRETEAIQRIIREWENLAPRERLNYLPEQIDPMATPSRDAGRNMEIKLKENFKTTSRKPQDEMAEPQAKAQPEEMMVMEKKKKISKRSEMANYITFFRFHFQRVREAHPNWDSAQISVIIGLLWKQEKERVAANKKANKETKEVRRPKIPGRRLFRKAMGLKNNQQVLKKWKRLPADSKRMWQRRGDPSIAQQQKMAVSTLTLGGKEGRELMQLMASK